MSKPFKEEHPLGEIRVVAGRVRVALFFILEAGFFSVMRTNTNTALLSSLN